jgi:hypothetical protein
MASGGITSFKSMYQKRSNTPCSCMRLAPSRFRNNPKTLPLFGVVNKQLLQASNSHAGLEIPGLLCKFSPLLRSIIRE